ncbi:hypothetical protein HK102_006235 [Quaeritorhiza haematococci]|nr:hypothetical protein HK102_006235 [Quaeritorhiza haematococci]
MSRPPIPSLSDFEHQKENIAPLPQGRRAKVLSALFSDSDVPSQQAQLEEQRRRFEELIAAEESSRNQQTEDSDPLEIYHQYLKWMQENYTSGHPELMQVLEKAVRRFKRDVRYKNDLRYLKMWLLLARRTREPVEVFKYLSVNEIGQDLGLFYEEYGLLMESLGRYKEADEIFQLGINRKAQDSERLTRKFYEFQKRMLTVRVERDEAFMPAPGSERAQPVLAVKSKTRTSSSSSTVPSAGSSVRPGPSRMNPVKVGQPGNSRRGPSKIQVYSDADNGGVAGVSLASQVLPSASSSNPWADFGTEASRRKENTREATQWKGVTLSQKQKGKPTSTGPKLEVYRDNPDAYTLQAPPESVPATETSVLGPKVVAAPSTSTLLEGLDSEVAPPSGSTLQESTDEVGGTRGSQIKSKAVLSLSTKNTKAKPPVKRSERFACDLSLVYVGDEEFSFEEIRAARVGYIPSPDEPQPQMMTEDTSSITSSDSKAIRQRSPVTKNPPEDANVESFAVRKGKMAVSPTINTKAALADVFEMFSQPLQCEMKQEMYAEEDETISSKVYRPEFSHFKIGVFNDSEPKRAIQQGGVAEAAQNIDHQSVNDENHYGTAANSLRNERTADANRQGRRALGLKEVPVAPLHQVPDDITAAQFRSVLAQKDTRAEAVPLSEATHPQIATGSASHDLNPFIDVGDKENAGSTSKRQIPQLFAGLQDKENDGLFQAPSVAGKALLPRTDDAWAKDAVASDQENDKDVHHTESKRSPTSAFRDAWQSEPSSERGKDREDDDPENTDDIQSNEQISAPWTYTTAVQDHTIYRGGRYLDIMTPIAETSRELDHTTSGVSTIASIRANNMREEDFLDPTIMTLGDRTILTLSDRTISSIGCADEVSGDYLDYQLPHTTNFGRNDTSSQAPGDSYPVSLPKNMVRIGKNTKSGPFLPDPIHFLEEGVSGIQIVDEEDEEGGLGKLSQSHSMSSAGREQILGDMHNVFQTPVGGEQKTEDDIEDPALRDHRDLTLGIGKSLEKACKPAIRGRTASASLNRSAYGKKDVQELENSSECVVELPGSGKYKLLRKLGEGGYAKVYLMKRLKERSRFVEEDDMDEFSADEDDDDEEEHSDSDFGDWDNTDDDYSGSNERQGRKEPKLVVFKVQSPPMSTEYIVLKKLWQRLPYRIIDSIVEPYGCDLFADDSCLRIGYSNQGNILDCVNSVTKDGYGAGAMGFGGMGGVAAGNAGLDELLAMFWTIELMRTIEGVHGAGFIHGDVKADNIMIRLKDSCFSSSLEARRNNTDDDESDDGKEWDTKYHSDGSGGWRNKGLTIVDWGTAVDVREYPAPQRFVNRRTGLSPTFSTTDDEEFVPIDIGIGKKADPSVESWEVRNGAPWKYEADWYGVAGVAHVLLFGKYMEVKEEKWEDNAISQRPHVRIAATLKRYWQVDIWREFFDVLLNAGEYNDRVLSQAEQKEDLEVSEWMVRSGGTDYEQVASEFPMLRRVREIRRKMEVWLEANGYKGGKSVRSGLKRVEVLAMEQAQKQKRRL